MYNSSNKKKMNSSGLRHRVRENNSSFPLERSNSRKQAKNPLPTPCSHFVAALLLLTFVSVIVILVEKKLPTPLMVADIPTNPGRFVAERSFNSLVKLTSLGPRPTGSYENEVLAIKFFQEEIDDIIQNAKPVHKVLLDIQRPRGSFSLGFLDGMNSVYVNVQNIVVKLTSKAGSPHSLLVNCHYDTVADSPGGSDDGASCAVMLEMLRIITQMDTPLKHNIIFLFNGAEENILQAAHGFITQHKWAKEIQAFVNLEACGAGGREVLFQAGPNHPWLMKKYADSVPYPYASSLAQEIFQSGVIPGDTDYRIFRDFGNISGFHFLPSVLVQFQCASSKNVLGQSAVISLSTLPFFTLLYVFYITSTLVTKTLIGLDFAWASNGYVYHTKFDTVEQIPLGSLQRTGDNILALLIAIANGNELEDIEKHAAGNLVFFDFLGAFVVRWSEIVNFLVNCLIIFTSLYTVQVNIRGDAARSMGKRNYVQQLGVSILIIVLSMVVTVAIALLIGNTISSLGRSMSWFARPVWIVFLYICPTLVIPMALVLFVSQWQKPIVHSSWTLYQLYNDANQLFWTVLLAVATMFSIRSGFVACIWVFFSCIGNLVKPALFKHWKDWRWLTLHVATFFLPFTQCFYLMLSAINLVLPIMGRVGAGNNSEVIVAVLLCSLFSLLLSFLTPVILLVRTPKRILGSLGGLFVAAVLVLVLTPLGFPYSGDPTSPAPQRFMLSHVERVYHNFQGNVTHHSTGFWIVDMDQNSPDTVKEVVPEMARAQQVENCDTQLFCGVPYLLPIRSLIWKTHWVPGIAPTIAIPTTFHLDSVEDRPEDVRRLTFTASGPDHMALILSPVPGIKLSAWSILEGNPLKSKAYFADRPTYFVYYSCANDPEPWTFWIDLKGIPEPNQPRVDLVLTSHFLHGKNKASRDFQQLMDSFPPWTAVTGWTSTYKSWKF